MEDSNAFKIPRRDFLAGTAGSVAAAAVPAALSAAQQPIGVRPTVTSKVSLTVNGARRDLEVDTRTTLLDALREHLKLTGGKKG